MVHHIRRVLIAVAYRRWVAALVVAAVSVLVSWAAVVGTDATTPLVHDEYSHLLAADTFLHGRVTNPPHPLWEHFEAMHVLVRPTYASKYPPGQGLSLAAGQLLTGHPMVGVWLTLALAAVATLWALRAWVSPTWALAGGLLCATHPLSMLWATSYFGGGLAALGGALAVGAVARLTRARVERARVRDAVLLALGLLTLANTRPSEGLVLSLDIGGVLVWWARRVVRRGGAGAVRYVAFRLALPALVPLVVGGTAMLYYNVRVTGDPLRLPYVEYEHQYAVTPLFVWQDVRPAPVYRHREIEWMSTGWELDIYRAQRAPGALVPALLAKAVYYLQCVFTPSVLLLPLVGALATLRRSWHVRAAFALVLPVGISLLAETYSGDRYAAPAFAPAVILLVLGWRALWVSRDSQLARFFARATLCAYVLALPVVLRQTRDAVRRRPWALHRTAIERQLAGRGGHHLVVVRYARDHNPHSDWVYNRADMYGTPVVWAREMDAAHMRTLLNYFRDRHVWLVEADMPDPAPVPYPAPPAPLVASHAHGTNAPLPSASPVWRRK